MGDTLSLHPSFSTAVVKRAIKRDAVRAMSEYGFEGKIPFRQSESSLVDQAPVDLAIVTDRRELAPVEGVTYVGFLDAAQGSRSGDSMTLAIAHDDDGNAVVDCVIEKVPPFSPINVLANDFVPVLERYGVPRVVGDGVSKGFVEQTLRDLGILFDVSTMDKSQLYLNLLNLLNSNAVQLPDIDTLRLQLLSLKRYPGANNRERIDHPKGRAYHDDVANVVAGAVALCSGVGGKKRTKVLFSGSTETQKASGATGLAALANATLRRLAARDAVDRALAAKYDELPVISPPIWRVGGSN
jgi:hypothetical protein